MTIYLTPRCGFVKLQKRELSYEKSSCSNAD